MIWRQSAVAILFLLVVGSRLHGSEHREVEDKSSARPRRILILNEVNASYPAIALIDDAIRESLEQSKYGIEIYREYMDTALFSSEADQKLIRELNIRKYQYRRPDVIITVGSSPLKFMVEKRREYFAGVPVIFCLPNGIENDLKPDPEITGVTMGTEAAATIDAALQLLVNTKHVLVVGGAGIYDRQTTKEVKEQLQKYSGRVEISYTNDLPMPELLKRLKTLPPDYIVLFTSMARDSAGTFYSSRESAPLINSASSVPVFTLVDTYIGHGEVGGNLSEVKAQGRIAGYIALKIFQGIRPGDIPVAKAPNGFVFDWRALKRWGLEQKKLPPGSTVLNRQQTPWEMYRWYFFVGGALVLLEALLISGLFVQWKRAREAESELGITYDRLRLAVEAGKSVGWDWDLKSGRDRWFGDLENIFGIPSDTYSGHVEDFRRRVHPDDRELVWRAVADARQNRSPYIAEFRVVREDGLVRWLTARGTFYYTSKGDAERMLGMAVDITDRKQAEAAVRESEERFRLLANSAPVLIWTSRTDKLCDYVNRTWLDFTGRTLDEELGDAWAKGIHTEDVKSALDIYTSAFDRREPFKMEYRLRRYDGEYRWMVDRGVPRFNTDGSFAGYVGSCSDITERRLAADALTTLSGKLIAAQEEERRRVAREIHDDYQQRLAMVANDVELLRHRLGDNVEETKQRLRHLWDEISELTSDLHSLSHRLHSSTLETLGLVAGVSSFCREFQQQQELKIDFVHENVPRAIPADTALCIFRVAQEALRNVKRHSGANYAEVRLELKDEELRLAVSDKGTGFDPAFRSPSLGIGIRSMEERLRLVGGRLEIQSRMSEGTIISARVPFNVSGHAAGRG
jgi:PAS domain S-box-containing protein